MFYNQTLLDGTWEHIGMCFQYFHQTFWKHNSTCLVLVIRDSRDLFDALDKLLPLMQFLFKLYCLLSFLVTYFSLFPIFNLSDHKITFEELWS